MLRAIHAVVIPARRAKGKTVAELDGEAIRELRFRGRSGILRPFRRRGMRDGSVRVVVSEIMARRWPN